MRNKKGFTLIEILVVIGLIAVLAAVVLIAINPARQFAQARDSQRQSNVSAILDAIGQRMADNKGVFAGSFTTNGTTYTCPALASGVTSTVALGVGTFVAPATALIDLSCLTPTYIATQLPYDPGGAGSWQDSTHYNTQYNVSVDGAGRITISAPNTEIVSPKISVTR